MGERRKCRGCDAVFTVKPHGNGRVWCSMACCNRTKRATGQKPKAPPKSSWAIWYGTCEICGQLWCGPKGGHKSATCQRDACRKEAKNRKSRTRYAADPTKGMERARLQRAARDDEARAKEAERRQAWWAQFPEATCAACGKPAGKPERKDRRQACSNACRAALRPPPRPKPQPIKFIKPPPITITRTCRRCATPFKTDIHNKLYCSKRCKNNRDCQPSTIRQATCPHCAKDFTTDRSWQIYCTNRCLKRAAHDRREVAKRTNGSAPIGRVDRGAVYQRDDWVCQLCDYPTNPDVTVPDYEAPTIDHIIPLARGGGHTMDNVQTAHFLCNMLKGDSLAS